MFVTITSCRNVTFGCPKKNPFTYSEIRPPFCKPSGQKNFQGGACNHHLLLKSDLQKSLQVVGIEMPQKTTPNKNFYFAIRADIFSSSIGRHPESLKLNSFLKNKQNHYPDKKKSLRQKPEAHKHIKFIPRNRQNLVTLSIISAVASTSHKQQNNLLQSKN
jgi:hypothetical protein